MLLHEKLPKLTLPIETKRLILRSPLLSDITTSQQAICAYLDWLKKPNTPDQLKKFIEHCIKNWKKRKNKFPHFVLFLIEKNNNEFIGVVELHHYNKKMHAIHVGYWANPTKSKQGYITEAVEACTNYLLNEVGLRKIIITCDADNLSSRKIPERLGYVLQSVMLNDGRDLNTEKIKNTLWYTRRGH
ncbi:MAG: hypothetical protein A3F12_00075 [Gammaproteobacteria bacterium RIFCSPHIGHO2_12_FULL_38_14]|nr:MAG: hypothetical protein A3F12_00075 [Gammaproteobacteria bacterium RIFCSPHIGHO2_12_FULL_38_14]